MKTYLPISWNRPIKVFKLAAVGVLWLIVMLDTSLLRSWGIGADTTFWIVGAFIFLFILTTAYQFIHHATPSIRDFRRLKEVAKDLLVFIPITHYYVYLRIMSNDLLYIFFATNLIYLSFRIEMVKWGGLILGILLIIVHLYALFVIIKNRKLVGIFISQQAIVYYEYSLEIIPWERIKQITLEGVAVNIIDQNDDSYNMSFEGREKDFTKFMRILRKEGQKRAISLEFLPEKEN